MNKYFVYFSTKAKFLNATQGTEYDFTSIVFIGDTKEIWNRGIFYATPIDFDIADYLTKSDAASQYQPKGNYLTEIPAEYVKTDALEEAIKDFVTSEELQSKLDEIDVTDQLEDYATTEYVNGELAKKADKSEIPSLEGYAKESWVEDKGYLTEHQSLTDYIKTSEVESKIATAVNDMATQTWVKGQNYLTEHQDLSDYAKTSEVEQAIEEAKEAIVGEDLKDSLDTLEAIKAWKEQHGTEYTDLVESVNSKADASAIEDMATKTWVGQQNYLKEHQSLEGYAKSTEISEAINGLNISQYETVTGAAGKYQPKGNYLTEHQSLDNYYNKAEVDKKITDAVTEGKVDLDGYATEQWVKEQKYLTEHQSLANYYTKEQVDAAVSEALEDAFGWAEY